MYRLTGFIPPNLPIGSWSDLKPYFERLKAATVGSLRELEDFIRRYSDVLGVYSEQNARAYIAMTRDTENKEAVRRHDIFNTEIGPQVHLASHEIDKKIAGSPHYGRLPPERYAIYKRGLERELKLFREENVPLEAELAQLASRYSRLTGGLVAKVRGDTMPLPQASALLTRNDRGLRREAWSAIQESRAAIKDDLDLLYADMVGLRHRIAMNAGYANFRDYKHDALERFDYTVEDVRAFHRAIRECVVPLAAEVRERHRSRLGLENDYRPWDLQGQPPGLDPLKPFATAHELVEKTTAVFTRLRPAFGENLRAMLKAELFDLESRKGKAPGGYNYGLEVTGMPFIFMNAAGLHRDMVTLMHEGGHAMHTFLVADEPLIFYRETPAEMAETASMGMELVSSGLWGEFYGAAELKRARREHLEDIISFFPWCATIDAFQHWVYENPAAESGDRDRRFDEVFGEFTETPAVVDWSGFEDRRRTLWHKQLHVFEAPFYYIEYGIAQLGALQVYRNYVRDPKRALDGYVAGLKLGSTRTLPEVWDAMGIRFDFSVGMIHELMGFVKERLDLLSP